MKFKSWRERNEENENEFQKKAFNRSDVTKPLPSPPPLLSLHQLLHLLPFPHQLLLLLSRS